MEYRKYCNYRKEDLPGSEMIIHYDWLYQISSFSYPVEFVMEDERLISLGNREIVVSGMTLIELMEEYLFSYIGERPSCGKTFGEAREFLNSFIEGQEYWGIENPKMDYRESLRRLEKEQMRVKNW